MTELKPCPKCHENTKLVMKTPGLHTMRIDCENCGHWFEVGWYDATPTEQMMADEWNSWVEFRKESE